MGASAVAVGKAGAGRRGLLLTGGALVAAAVLVGCSSSDGGSAGSGASPEIARGTADQQAGYGAPAGAPVPAAGSGAAGGVTAGKAGPATQGGTQADDVLDGRSVIRTAELTVRVPHVLDASSAVTTAASAVGGYVAGEETTADPAHADQARAVLTVRIPASQLPAFLSRLHGMGDLLAEQQQAQDVTGQVIDVQARLATQAASVTRVRALLAQATTLGQVVQIEGELAKREADLESLQAQSKALADQTSLATVTVTLAGPAAVAPTPQPEPAGFGTGLSKGWHAFVEATTWLLTALGALLPFLVLATLVGLPVWWLTRRRRPAATGGDAGDDVAPTTA
jgi:hypothetical protein